jgi:2-polyprenyl-3-methyl-5-hydroxy-6-metoxy-1,4-benzoquinol methylase
MGNLQLVTRLCPICDNSYVEVLFNLEMILQENFGLPGKYSIVACEQCGFVYQDSQATLQDYENYYKLFNKYDSSPTILEETKELFLHYINKFKQFVNKESLILDMGCAGGIFLNLLKENGYCNLVGVDPSYDCAKDIKEKGIEAYVGSIYSNELTFLENKFDLIVLSGVMEHLFDLKNAVHTLEKYLKDEGMLFIGVPDVERYCNYNNATSYYFNFEHINHFSPVSLGNLMLEFNYKNINTSLHDIRFGASIVPVFSSLFRKDDSLSGRFQKDEVSSLSVKKYLELAKDKRGNDLSIIAELLGSNEEIIIWGAGCVASELLSGTNLKHCNIKAFVDKDPGKHGKMLLGKTICPADILYGFNGTIVICAALYAIDITNEIRKMDIKNRIIILK